jgi:hypothetical protein
VKLAFVTIQSIIFGAGMIWGVYGVHCRRMRYLIEGLILMILTALVTAMYVTL